MNSNKESEATVAWNKHRAVIRERIKEQQSLPALINRKAFSGQIHPPATRAIVMRYLRLGGETVGQDRLAEAVKHLSNKDAWLKACRKSDN